MVVVAIIAILALAAIPQYQRYAMKARLAGAYAELTAARRGVDAQLIEGKSLVDLSPAALGIPPQGHHCTRYAFSQLEIVNFDIYLQCETKDIGIGLFRSADKNGWTHGDWLCQAGTRPGFSRDLLPEQCR